MILSLSSVPFIVSRLIRHKQSTENALRLGSSTTHFCYKAPQTEKSTGLMSGLLNDQLSSSQSPVRGMQVIAQRPGYSNGELLFWHSMVFTKLVKRILKCGEFKNIILNPDAFWMREHLSISSHKRYTLTKQSKHISFIMYVMMLFCECPWTKVNLELTELMCCDHYSLFCPR